MSYVCPECETKIVRLYEEGDCSYCENLLAEKLEDHVPELDDHRNVGYTWYCTDKSCNAGSEGWPGDRTECPPTEEDFKTRKNQIWNQAPNEMEKLMVKQMVKHLLGDYEEVDG